MSVQAAEGNLQSHCPPDKSDWWFWSIPGLPVLPLPAWGWATRNETGSRHSPSGITDSRDPVQTLQLFPSFSFFPIVRCGIAIGGPPTAILWFEKAFKLVSLELRSARCKTEAIETWEKWRSGRWKSGQSQTWWMKGTRSFQLVSWPWEALACLITFLVWAWRSHL